MSNVSQNPNFHLSKPPHKLSNKHVVLKNKPTKKSTTRSRNKNNINNHHLMMLNNSSNNNNHTTSATYCNNNNNNNNNRPLKVVHISNPMRFQVAAAGFRALVQGLTGRDAVVEWPIDHESQVVAANNNNDDSTDGGNNSTDDHSHEVNGQQDDHQEDEVANFSACCGPSDHHLMSFDYFGTHFNGDISVDDVEFYGCYGGSDLRAFMGDE